MKAEEAKAIMVEAKKNQTEKVCAETYENIEKYILPYIAKEAEKGKSCTIINIPKQKEICADKLVELGYNVIYEKGKKLFVRWA